MLRLGYQLNGYTIIAAWLMKAGHRSDHVVILGHDQDRERDQFVVARVSVSNEPTSWEMGNYSGTYEHALKDFLRLTQLDTILLQNPPTPSVQIVHSRHPDEGCEHTVFVNDERVEADIEDIDPGRGYKREDWNERIRSYLGDTSNFGTCALQVIDAYADSEFIADDSARLMIDRPWPTVDDPVYAMSPEGRQPVKADRWFAQLGDMWVAVTASESEAEWFADAAADGELDELPTPYVRPINDVPTTGTLLWRDHWGNEMTYENNNEQEQEVTQ